MFDTTQVSAQLGKHKMTQATLQKHLGIKSNTTLQSRLNGKTKFDVEELATMSALFNVPKDYFFKQVVSKKETDKHI